MKHWIQIFLFIISVQLAWDASLDSEGVVDTRVTGYKLYYGNATGSYGTVIDVGNVTTYTIASVHEEQPIFFALKAYDAYGNESAYSTELECATIYQSVNGHAAITGQMTGWASATSRPAFVVESKTGKHVVVTITPESEIYSLTALKLDGAWVETPSTTVNLNSVTQSHVVYGVIQRRPTITGMDVIH